MNASRWLLATLAAGPRLTRPDGTGVFRDVAADSATSANCHRGDDLSAMGLPMQQSIS